MNNCEQTQQLLFFLNHATISEVSQLNDEKISFFPNIQGTSHFEQCSKLSLAFPTCATDG